MNIQDKAREYGIDYATKENHLIEKDAIKRGEWIATHFLAGATYGYKLGRDEVVEEIKQYVVELVACSLDCPLYSVMQKLDELSNDNNKEGL